MRNFLLGILFTLACAWIASYAFLAYQCIDAEGSRWAWMPLTMGYTEYAQQLDSVTSCTFDQVEKLLGGDAVHYYFNFPSAVAGLALLVMLGPALFRESSPSLDKDEVRRKAKRWI